MISILHSDTELRKSLEKTTHNMHGVGAAGDEAVKDFWMLRSTQLEKERRVWISLCVVLGALVVAMWFQIAFSRNQ